AFRIVSHTRRTGPDTIAVTEAGSVMRPATVPFVRTRWISVPRATQIVPSGPAAIAPSKYAPVGGPREDCVTVPSVATGSAASPRAIHSRRSGPAIIAAVGGVTAMTGGRGNAATTPSGVMRPTTVSALPTNHMLWSAPGAIAVAFAPGYSVTAPLDV